MDSLLKNITYVTYGMGFMFFFSTWLRLHSLKAKSRIILFLYLEFTFMLFAYFKNLLFVSDVIRADVRFLRIYNAIDVMLIPLSAVFLITLLSPGKLKRRHIVLIHTPSALLSAAYLLTFDDTVLMIMAIYTALFVVFMIILIYVSSTKYDAYIKNNFSNIDQLTVAWIRKGILFLSGYLLIWGVSNLFDAWISIILYNLLGIVFWYLLYHFTMNHQSVENMPDVFSFKPQLADERPSGNGFLSNKLNDYMEQEKPYLLPTLSLSDLATAIGTNRTYLSEFLNSELRVTFYDYINTYRIGIACELLKETNLSLEMIAEQSGFNSLSTFRRSFIKNMCCTPKQYKNRHTNG